MESGMTRSQVRQHASALLVGAGLALVATACGTADAEAPLGAGDSSPTTEVVATIPGLSVTEANCWRLEDGQTLIEAQVSNSSSATYSLYANVGPVNGSHGLAFLPGSGGGQPSAIAIDDGASVGDVCRLEAIEGSGDTLSDPVSFLPFDRPRGDVAMGTYTLVWTGVLTPHVAQSPSATTPDPIVTADASKSGELQLITDLGYQLTGAYSFQLSDLAIDIASQPPGRALITATRTTQVELTNVTTGRAVTITDPSHMPSVYVVGMFPADSATCRAGGLGRGFPSDLVGNERFCAVRYASMTQTQPARSWPVDGTVTITQDDILRIGGDPTYVGVVAEDDAELIVAELRKPTLWGLFVSETGGGTVGEWMPDAETGVYGKYPANGSFIFEDPSSAAKTFGLTALG